MARSELKGNVDESIESGEQLWGTVSMFPVIQCLLTNLSLGKVTFGPHVMLQRACFDSTSSMNILPPSGEKTVRNCVLLAVPVNLKHYMKGQCI